MYIVVILDEKSRFVLEWMVGKAKPEKILEKMNNSGKCGRNNKKNGKIIEG